MYSEVSLSTCVSRPPKPLPEGKQWCQLLVELSSKGSRLQYRLTGFGDTFI